MTQKELVNEEKLKQLQNQNTLLKLKSPETSKEETKNEKMVMLLKSDL